MLRAMGSLRVAVVSRDERVRVAAARACDEAPATWEISLHETPPAQADVVVFGPDVERTGGVAFDPAAPERLVDDVARAALARRSKVVAVTGAGGGTGVTSVALHLARAMTSFGTTCFLDLDVRWGAADRLGLSGPELLSWIAAEPGPEGLRRASVPVAGGFRALLAPRGGAPEVPEDLVARASEAFERVVVDVPTGPLVEDAVTRAGAAVLVVSPTPPGARRAAEILAFLPEVRWAVVTNRVGPGGETTNLELRRILGCPITIALPCSPGLRDAEDDGRLVTSAWSRWRHAVDRLAALLEAA